jgi:hypothetical protein
MRKFFAQSWPRPTQVLSALQGNKAMRQRHKSVSTPKNCSHTAKLSCESSSFEIAFMRQSPHSFACRKCWFSFRPCAAVFALLACAHGAFALPQNAAKSPSAAPGASGTQQNTEQKPPSTGEATLAAGLWEITQTRKGGPGAERTSSRSVCLSASDLTKTPEKLLLPVPDEKKSPKCQLENLTVGASTLTYQARCQTPMGEKLMRWEGTHNGLKFESASSMKMAWMRMSLRLTGKRVGACGTP